MAVQLPRRPTDQQLQSRYRGCLLGGAVGDALGAPVEFMNASEITSHFGAAGIQEFVPAFGRLGAITDDTQMTLFTAEGVLRSVVRGTLRGLCHAPTVIAHAYMRWLHTQGRNHPSQERCLDGWLIGHRELFSRRAPGVTCLSGLESLKDAGDKAINDSKGCGGAMRVAPIGMYFATLALANPGGEEHFAREAFELACEAAAITHGHPTGQLASGVFATVVMHILTGTSMQQSIADAANLLKKHPKHTETLAAVNSAQRLAAAQPQSAAAVRQLGEGWVAEEALAIALYCALTAEDFRSGVSLAVNHGGDSDSTGSMTGQLLGALLGQEAIPSTWRDPVELRIVIEEVADDLATVLEWRLDDDTPEEVDYYFQRYPGA